jgi:hypothetical protein
MSPRLRNTMDVALVGLLCLAPLGMAVGTAAEKTPGVSSAHWRARPRSHSLARDSGPSIGRASPRMAGSGLATR